MLPMLGSATMRGWWAPDEPRYAEVAREIFVHGNGLVMHLCGDLYPDKPPLLFWLSGLLGWLSGWSEFAMRMPSLLATFFTAWLIARIAGRWWGSDAARWAPAVFLTSAMVTEIGGRLQIDPLLTVLCVAALELLTQGRDAPRPELRVLIAGLLVGIGGLAKGPVALINVAIPVALWATAGPREVLPKARVRTWIGAVALALGVPVVWAIAASLHEPSLWAELFFGQHAGRVTHADRHPGPLWKHLERMPLLLLPWTAATIAGLVGWWRARRERRRNGGGEAGDLLAGWWLVGLFVFYSIIPPKRDLYLLPAYPAAALLAAATLVRGFDRGRLSRWITWTASLPCVLVGLLLSALPVAMALPSLSDRLASLSEFPGIAWRAPAAGLPLLVGAAISLILLRRDPRSWAKALIAGWTTFGIALALVIMPAIDPVKSTRSVAEELAARPEKPSAIPCFGGVRPEGYRFYGNGRVPTVYGHDLEAALQREGDQFLALIQSDAWQQVDPRLQERLRVVAERQVGGKPFVIVGTARPGSPAVASPRD